VAEAGGRKGQRLILPAISGQRRSDERGAGDLDATGDENMKEGGERRKVRSQASTFFFSQNLSCIALVGNYPTTL
jgi:hypothetical protein